MAKSQWQPNGGAWIRPVKRLAIYLRDGFVCLYCGRDLHGANPRNISLDHLKCRAEGGSNDSNNLVTACHMCNSTRRNTPWTEFATGGAKDRIRRHIRRKLTRYLLLAIELRTKDRESDETVLGSKETV